MLSKKVPPTLVAAKNVLLIQNALEHVKFYRLSELSTLFDLYYY